jgi:signal transduction histidine kinase
VSTKTIISILLILLLNKISFCQESRHRTDSLLQIAKNSEPKEQVSAYIDISRLYFVTNPDTAMIFAVKAFEIAQNLKNDDLLGDVYNNYGNVYLFLGENQKALDNYLIAKDLREKVGIEIKVAYTLNNMAFAYRNLNLHSETINTYKEAAEISKRCQDYESEANLLMGVASTYSRINNKNKALEYGIKAANIYIHLGNKLGLADTYNFLGTLHKNMNNTNLALEYYKKSHEIYLTENNRAGISIITNNLGTIFDELGDNEKALEFYQKSLDYAIESNNKDGQATSYNNIGFLFSKTKDYPKSLEAYQKSVELSEELKNRESSMNTYNNIAWVYYHTGNINKSIEYVMKALSYSDESHNLYYTSESYEILSKIYFDKGEYKKGYEHLEKFMALKDSLFNINSNEMYMEMQVRFETESKEKEIEILKKNDEIKNLQIQRQKNFNLFWLLFTLILSLVIGMVFFSLQSKKKLNNLLTDKNRQLEDANNKLIESELHLKELNATKDRFFSLIAHDLKNPFGALIGFSELLNKNFDNYSTEEAKGMVKIIFDSSNKLYKLLDNLLQWSRSQTGRITFNPENIPLLQLVKQEVEVLENLAHKKSIKLILRIEDYLMVYADKNLVSIIVRNLLSNAIKFSNEGGRIIFTAQDNDKMLELSITDSGVGMTKSEIDQLFRLDTSFTTKGTADEEGSGLGLLICKEFIEMNGGRITVNSEKDKGSTFAFTLPTVRFAQQNSK